MSRYHLMPMVLALLVAACTDPEVSKGDADGGGGSGEGGEGANSQGGQGGVGGPGGDGGGGAGGGAGGSGAWEAPIGIPDPEFGIEEEVDTTCAGCAQVTATSEQELEGIAAGTVVELGADFCSGGGTLTISGNGTATQPIFVRGASADDPARICRPTEVSGSYLILENIDFDWLSGSEGGLRLSGDHLALRHSAAHDYQPGHNSTVVFTSSADHVVIHDNHIHDNGDFGASGEIDVHGIGAGNSWDIWIVDNHIHHNRGDGMQFGHRAGNTLGRIYVGRNDSHDNGENSVDIKEASDVIVSENILHDDAAGNVVFHDCPLNAALIFNDVSGSSFGVSLPSLESACDGELPVELFVLGNTFDDASEAIQG
ncbi:MAG: right-handed parallel beta-helix repeat-containing protein, partial [Myxococcales bacterium]|nr:right-handed parallel beta-helix repeat-containing protein [Myxococcales bacterium]